MIFAAAAAGLTAVAQQTSIRFETDTAWNCVLETARAQHRIIFVDCYTDWCGPCRHVAQSVFPVEEVTAFFNANFVNAKVEMEKSADGPALMKKYDVRGFPTFLFIDPQTEELVYIKLGSGEGYRWLIEAGERALDPMLNKPGMERRYGAGERDAELVINYLKLLGNLSQPAAQAAVTEEYLDAHAGEGIFSAETWEVLGQSVMDPLSAYFPAIVRERQRFYDIVGEEAVDAYLEGAIRRAAEKMVHPIWQPGAFAEPDGPEERHARLIEVYSSVEDYPAAAMFLAFLETADLARLHRWDAMLDMMERVDAGGVIAADRDVYDYFRYNMIPLGRDGGSPGQIARAQAMLKRKSEAAANYDYEYSYFQLSNQIEFLAQ